MSVPRIKSFRELRSHQLRCVVQEDLERFEEFIIIKQQRVSRRERSYNENKKHIVRKTERLVEQIRYYRERETHTELHYSKKIREVKRKLTKLVIP